jgi:hypothetical protein
MDGLFVSDLEIRAGPGFTFILMALLTKGLSIPMQEKYAKAIENAWDF